MQKVEPGQGQESVWDYPRPPRIDDCRRRVRVFVNGVAIADSERAKRVLETSHPPVIYIPSADVDLSYFTITRRTTWCEWKGHARYYTIRVKDDERENAAWCYPEPTPAFEVIRDYIAVYPGRMDDCWLGDERVQAQAGDFYGGWITADIVGPFKGGQGTWGW